MVPLSHGGGEICRCCRHFIREPLALTEAGLRPQHLGKPLLLVTRNQNLIFRDNPRQSAVLECAGPEALNSQIDQISHPPVWRHELVGRIWQCDIHSQRVVGAQRNLGCIFGVARVLGATKSEPLPCPVRKRMRSGQSRVSQALDVDPSSRDAQNHVLDSGIANGNVKFALTQTQYHRELSSTALVKPEGTNLCYCGSKTTLHSMGGNSHKCTNIFTGRGIHGAACRPMNVHPSFASFALPRTDEGNRWTLIGCLFLPLDG
mmetsp:Transcript_32063/g.70244  ORF Transcript_32063/g.70244 Transcript_32063/m.70244 type:complete len:261 (+) Transcript_32063:665-1447(+)